MRRAPVGPASDPVLWRMRRASGSTGQSEASPGGARLQPSAVADAVATASLSGTGAEYGHADRLSERLLPWARSGAGVLEQHGWQGVSTPAESDSYPERQVSLRTQAFLIRSMMIIM